MSYSIARRELSFRIISEWPTRSIFRDKGTTKDSFQMAGKTPADSDKLKTNVKGTLTTEVNRFKIAGVIQSGPGPLLTSKPRKVHSISSSEISIADIL
jgi:hypothetical protein